MAMFGTQSLHVRNGNSLPITGIEWGILTALFAVSCAVAAVIHATNGSIVTGFGLVLALGLLLLTIYRIEWSLFLLIGMVLLFDQDRIPGFRPFTYVAKYFVNLKEHPYLPQFDAGVTNLVELHIFLLLLVWLVVFAAQRPKPLTPVPVWGAAILCFGGIVFFFIHGLRIGGEFLPAVWEVRALIYLGFFYWFVPQLVRTKEHVKTLVWVFIGVITFKALQGVARFWALGLTFGGYPTLTNHEDPVFVTTLVILLLGLVLFQVRTPQLTALLWLLLPLLAGFYAGQRRTAYAGMAISFIAFVILLPKAERWALIRIFLPIVFIGAVYCAVFWESESRWASPVRLIKTGLYSDEQEEAGDRYYSNLYRDFENYNLAFTVKRAPVLGVGFGNKYDMPIPLADIPFPLRDFIAHNQVLWFLAKTGAVGYFCFWIFFNCFAFRGAYALRRFKDPYFKAISVMIVVAIFNQMVASYYDLQLTFYRNMVYLGCLMGLLGAMENIERQHTPPSAGGKS